MMKNCFNCKWLEYMDDGGCEHGGNDGFACNKREYRRESEEENHLAQLEGDNYLKKAKSCCELKAV